MKALCFLVALLLAGSPLAAAPSAGSANLALSLSMIVAGNGPQAFKTITLIRALDPSRNDREYKRLQKLYGPARTQSFLKVSDFVVADALEIMQRKQIDLPDEPSPPPQDTKRLIAALYGAGVTPGGQYDPRAMLDTLVGPTINTQIARDVETKFGSRAAVNYYAALKQLMSDLRAAAAAAARTR